MQRHRRRKLYEYVVEDLAVRILRGEYRPGDTLPNEEALCREMEVSRGVLREATKVLVQKGLIELGPKTGTRVTARSRWNLFDPDLLLWKLKVGNRFEFLQDVTEVRAFIESEAARFAAERASPGDVEKIEAAFEKMEEALGRSRYDYEAYVQIDMAFHTAILEACRNDLLARIGFAMRHAVLQARSLDTRDIRIQRESLPFHRAILDAVAAREPEAAHSASRRMFEHVWRNIPRKKE
jgi:DNA-binding FadR family transcriptional regulator